MKKELSVIMSVYKSDQPEYVQQALNSILVEQTVRPAEVLLVVDGPVSGMLYSLLNEYEVRFPDVVKVLQQTENRGLAHALNVALEHCHGEYIARMDADDISLPERFEKQVTFLQAHPDVDCVGTWAIEIRADGTEYFRKKMPVTHDECWEQFKIRDCMIHPTVMFRRSYFEKAGRYDESTYFGEDTMMWAQGFAAGCRFANIPEYLFKFRLDDNFFNRRRGWKHAKSILSLRWKVNRKLHYPISAYLYAILYAFAKMMPEPILNLIYKTAR